MSVRVEMHELADHVRPFGNAAYLVSVGVDLRPKVMHVDVFFDHGSSFDQAEARFRCAVGPGSARNFAEQPAATLVWSQQEAGGYSLIVDGHATVDEHPDVHGHNCSIVPTAAVLHRPAPSTVPTRDVTTTSQP